MAGASPAPAGAAVPSPAQLPSQLMPPPPPRAPGAALLRPAPPPPRVLEEDEYTMYLEEIIERDFFPELPRLKNRLDWLEATRSGDPDRIRAAQLRIQERLLARTPGGGAVGTPSVGTPLSGSSEQSTPARGYAAQDEGHRGAAALAEALAAAASGSPADLSLDAFLARYTSEDNASFNALLAKVNAQRAAQLPVAAARAAEAEAAAHTAAMRAAADAAAASAPPPLLLAAGGGDDGEGAGSSVQVFAGVASGRHVAKNSLFYAPDGRALTLAEAEAAVKGPARGVNIAATRFAAVHAAPDAPPAGEARSAVARTPGLRGYSMLATPSPAPGVGDSPFMTWGRLDATPLRLDPFAADDPPLDAAAAGGRAFHIAPPRKRDEIGHALAHGKGGSLRGRGGSGAGGATPSRAAAGGLSEAALRVLARSRGGSERGGTDWDLRRSYATPGATPARATPAPSRGATPRATPAPSPAATPLRAAKRPREDAPAAGQAAKPPGGSITDGLLKL